MTDVFSISFTWNDFFWISLEQTPPTDPHIGKQEDQRLALYILNEKDVNGHKLVKEHVERRTLRNPLQPLMDQVKSRFLKNNFDF